MLATIMLLPMQDITCYAMNREGDVDRHDHLLKQTQKLAVVPHVIKAVVPSSEDYDRLMSDGTIAANRVCGPRRKFFKTGEIGHYMSMAKIFDHYLSRDDDDTHLMTLEDDVVFPDDFLVRLEQLRAQLPRGWDVLSLSWSKTGPNRGELVSDDLLIPDHLASYQRRGVFVGTECMLFHREAVARIRAMMFPQTYQTDKFLDTLKNVDYLRLYVPVTPVTSQSDAFISTIGWAKKGHFS